MAAKPAFSLIVFDCDGVLVDSEMLSAGVLMGMMEEVGLPITPEIFRTDFLGRSFAAAAARAEIRFGRRLPDDFPLSYRKRLLARMAVELKAMDGVFDVLRNLQSSYCLATSSSPERLSVSLAATGLESFFAGRCFTASEVKKGKPAPDLFLHAAKHMGFAPRDSLVVEDSEMGLRAAKAAGMEAWHFAGGAHVMSGYRLPDDIVPARVTATMAELRAALAQLGLCRGAGVALPSSGSAA